MRKFKVRTVSGRIAEQEADGFRIVENGAVFYTSTRAQGEGYKTHDTAFVAIRELESIMEITDAPDKS